MNVVWFSWKDISHPLAGGAEIVSNNIRERLVKDGHNVTLYTARYKNSARRELVNGVRVRRLGTRYTVYALCFISYVFTKKSKKDIVVDEMNTLPFWVGAFTKKLKILLCYQLARDVWHYQLKKPLSTIGYFIEPIYLRILALFYTNVITESKSTADDLQNYGFNNTHIFRIGMPLTPLRIFTPASQSQMSSIVFLGALRPMKRPLDAIRAFELAKEKLPALTLTLIGSDSDEHAKEVREYVGSSRYEASIRLLGTVSQERKEQILKNAGVTVVTSIKEGWGLIVTEAGSMGVPSIAYDTDGLRDSIIDKKTGLLVKNGSVSELAEQIIKLLSDKKLRDKYAENAYEFSKQFTFENSYNDFLHILKKITDL